MVTPHSFIYTEHGLAGSGGAVTTYSSVELAAPYFFLGYAHTPEYSWVNKLYQDLCAEIMERTKEILRWVYGVLFALAGANHFVHTDFYVGIMPPYLPWHLALVYVSGACEIAFGIALLIRSIQQLAAWGMIALIVAVTPANLHMAVHSELYPQFSATALWIRMLLQLVLLAWAYWYTRPQMSARLV